MIGYDSLVKISPSVTLELEKNGQRMTIDIEEARQIIKKLGEFVRIRDYRRKSTPRTRIQNPKRRIKAGESQLVSLEKIPHMSESKRKEILDHLSKHLSAKPKTLSDLLKGVSYVPNHLPHIRRMMETRHDVAKKMIGKRTYYVRKQK